MGTALDTGTPTAGPPFVKIPNLGDHLHFGVVDIELDVPVYKFNPKPGAPREQEMTASGKPKTGHRLTVLALGGQAFTVQDQQYVPVPPREQGETVLTVFIDSYAKYDPDNDKAAGPDDFVSWGEAIKRAGGLEVGMIGTFAFVREFPPTMVGNDPRKDRKFKLRAARPEELAIADRCEALRLELKAAASTSTPLPTGGAPTTVPPVGSAAAAATIGDY